MLVDMQLGPAGAFVLAHHATAGLAAELEEMGYGAVWVGGSPPGDLALEEALLDATSTITIATGIVNMWKDDAATVARSYHRIEAAHPGRFLLGVGIGHPEAVREYRTPYDKAVAYLDELDAAGVPVDRRVLAALGPRMLRLAAERCAGAHPYLTPPAHTADARAIVGPDALLVPEHKVTLDSDPDRARALGQAGIKIYLGLSNYRNNLLRYGFTEADLEPPGSERLLDALVLRGDLATITHGLQAHLDAGADQIAVHVLDEKPAATFRAVAEAMGVT
jgi:probable F420-dependent oxidoreductase